jgi:Uma2 family endonuclease
LGKLCGVIYSKEEMRYMELQTIRHQRILMALSAQLYAYLRGKTCKVLPAPVGVRLSEKEDTVFEPDIVVVCDKSKLEGGKMNVYGDEGFAPVSVLEGCEINLADVLAE